MEENQCKRCKGAKSVHVTLKDKGGRDTDGMGTEHIIACPQCSGKGYITQQEKDELYNQIMSWGNKQPTT